MIYWILAGLSAVGFIVLLAIIRSGAVSDTSEVVEWHIDTEGLRVGSKLWNGTLGWMVVVRIEPGKVWARPE